ncbi:chemotaxis protein CheW, partial [Geobacter pelophilus]
MAELMEKSSQRAGAPAVADSGQEYVTFTLNDEIYAFDALQVQEIIELTSVTKVPHLPGYLKGVINLRGTIIPVIDLKLKFGMVSGEYKKHTCIIVTEYSRGVMGLIVDSVSDILNIHPQSISDAPNFGTSINTEFIAGMAKTGDSLVLVLDVDRVLTEEEATIVQQVAASDGIQ